MGINFDVDLDKIVNINYNERILQIEKLIKIWSKRNLTVIGKITVVKTLILPVLNHLIITLPNPTQDILNGNFATFYMLAKYVPGDIKYIFTKFYQHISTNNEANRKFVILISILFMGCDVLAR